MSAEPEVVARQAARWVYTGIWSILTGWFMIPREPPTLPAGRDGSLETFRPDDGFLRYLVLWFWIVVAAIDLPLVATLVAIGIDKPLVGVIVGPPILVVVLLLEAAFYVGIHLRFDTTWYVMTSSSLRIRRGAWLIHEMTFTFENVQNVKVQQGPVQRAFGIASVIIETAGSGEASKKQAFQVSNQGLIEGIADPHRIRDLILARMRRSRGAGLGDDRPAEAATRTPAWTAAHLAALRDIRDAVHKLSSSGA